jgi:ABC-type multidrug transport system ATPase subunit
MFKHFKIINVSGSTEINLLNLGRINVFCGRNNSGKSTILRAINDEKRCSPGYSSTEAEIDEITETIFARPNYAHSVQEFRTYINTRFKELARETIVYKGVVDSGVEHFLSQTQNSQNLQSILGELFSSYLDRGETLSRVPLIPPKREIEAVIEIGKEVPVTSDGTGVLAQLFYMKNRTPGHPGRHMFDAIRRAFTDISGGWTFEIFSDGAKMAELNFSPDEKRWVSATACGHGLQDLLLILFFSAGGGRTVLLEEPENHLHPEMQRKLLSFLKTNSEAQFFITTHSNIFLDNAYVDRVFFVRYEHGSGIAVDDATSRSSILDDLGYNVTDNLVSDLVILVEGVHDIPVVEEFLKKFGLQGKYNIRTWPLCGNVMNQLDLEVLSQGFRLIALIDNDPESDKVREEFIANCKANNIKVRRLERYAIENYFPLEILRKIYPNEIPADMKGLDLNTPIKDQLHLSVRKKTREIARRMTTDDIRGTDLETFFNEVRVLCESESPLIHNRRGASPT